MYNPMPCKRAQQITMYNIIIVCSKVIQVSLSVRETCTTNIAIEDYSRGHFYFLNIAPLLSNNFSHPLGCSIHI
ncbi:ORF1313 [White spot syndrome virus]|uniref:ORF1313 n=1 Tax=White spot syndrome virus TaxID=342409 RepID=A0A2D3I6E1_9VIRU|nr:ORF1313 [White spot syndrome virus]